MGTDGFKISSLKHQSLSSLARIDELNRNRYKKNSPDLDDVELVKLPPVDLRVHRRRHPGDHHGSRDRQSEKKRVNRWREIEVKRRDDGTIFGRAGLFSREVDESRTSSPSSRVLLLLRFSVRSPLSLQLAAQDSGESGSCHEA